MHKRNPLLFGLSEGAGGKKPYDLIALSFGERVG